MTQRTDAWHNPATQAKRQWLAYAIATALGTGYLRPSPGTYGSLVGVGTIVVSAIFFLHPVSVTGWFSQHPLSEAMFADRHFLVPRRDIRDSTFSLPLLYALFLLLILAAIASWTRQSVRECSSLYRRQSIF